jgi:hypothetical protein
MFCVTQLEVAEFRERDVYQLIFLQQALDSFPLWIIFGYVADSESYKMVVPNLQVDARILEGFPLGTVRHADVVNDSQGN